MITTRNTVGAETTWWPHVGQSIYIVGPSGSGKSTLLYNLARKYIDEGQGIGVIDPHGDLVDELLQCIPKDRVKETAYFSPEMGLNLVEYGASPLKIEHTLEAFRSIWPMDTLTERLLRHALVLHSYVAESSLCDVLKTLPNNDEVKHEYTVESGDDTKNDERIAELEAKLAVATLRFEEATKALKTKESTLLSLQNTMQGYERKIAAAKEKTPKETKKEIKVKTNHYRNKIVRKCEDEMTWTFWHDEYPTWQNTPRFEKEAVTPLMTMLETLLASPVMRQLFCVPHSTIDMRYRMDLGHIFLCNLSRGTLGDTTSRLLGAIILSLFRSAAFSRADTKQRKPFLLIVDEFHELAGPGIITSLLSAGRKYGLSLALAHQYADQAEDIVAAALGNCPVKIAFRAEGAALEKQFKGWDFDELTGRAVVKEGDETFAGWAQPKQLSTLAERLRKYAKPERVRRHSTQRYGNKMTKT